MIFDDRAEPFELMPLTRVTDLGKRVVDDLAKLVDPLLDVSDVAAVAVPLPRLEAALHFSRIMLAPWCVALPHGESPLMCLSGCEG
ncbi:hypothetical protein [Streptomyces werraensis]|uniref:hypothetical protein n=1 Tax=Streptomyces werraensis TaxID=68284 RepID=UPI0033A4C410